MTTTLALWNNPENLPGQPANWDLYVDNNGNIAINTGGLQLAQDAASAIKTFLGEVYYDTNYGVPYFQTILGKLPPLALVKALFVQAALTVPGVVQARCYLTSFNHRTFSGQVQITDETGQVFTANF
jgi:hypothetical protein